MTGQPHREMVSIAVESGRVEGMLALPATPCGMVLFAHGSGSGRHSPRNNFVAGELRKADLGTLVMDLLTGAEDRDTATRFDIDLLSGRLALVTAWLAANLATSALPLGLFGASTGAAAALQLAAASPDAIGAVVARGGRPDLAGDAQIVRVRAPTLLIVGGADTEVLALNQRAFAQLRCPRHLDIVPGASHLFEEPGALAQVARLATAWFVSWLAPMPARPRDGTA